MLPLGLLLLLAYLQLLHFAIIRSELASLLAVWGHLLQSHQLIQLFVFQPQNFIGGQPVVLFGYSPIVEPCLETTNIILIVQLVILS